jgi:hypothetical protein
MNKYKPLSSEDATLIDLIINKQTEVESMLFCNIAITMYGGECHCEPLQYCWGHVHGKHWAIEYDPT